MDALLAADVRIQDSAQADALAGLLLQTPRSEQYLEVRADVSEWAGPDAALGMLVSRTRVFFNVTRFKELRGELVVAILTHQITQDPAAATLLTAAYTLLRNLTVLSDDEAEVVRVMLALAGSAPHPGVVAEDDVRRAYQDATIELNPILDGLQQKGIIERRRPDGHLAVVW